MKPPLTRQEWIDIAVIVLGTPIVAFLMIMILAPAHGQALHPNIEDRRDNDTTLWSPAVPYSDRIWRDLPTVPVGRGRGMMETGANGCEVNRMSFGYCRPSSHTIIFIRKPAVTQ